jgi:hypothetical protein
MEDRLHSLERKLAELEANCVTGQYPGARRCLAELETDLELWTDPTLGRAFDRLREQVAAEDPDQVAGAVSDLRDAVAQKTTPGPSPPLP